PGTRRRQRGRRSRPRGAVRFRGVRPEGALTAEQGGEAVAAEPTAEVARTAPSDGIDPATSEAGEHQHPAQTTFPEESAETMAPSEGRPAAGSGAGARTDEASSHEGLMAVPGAEFA